VQACHDQVVKDVPRTFPLESAMDAEKCAALHRVLVAYASHNPQVGYCQGMNFIAGLLLLHMPEEDAFWGLVRMVQEIMPGYFDIDMRGALLDQQATHLLLQEHFPTVLQHCRRHNVDMALITSQWCALTDEVAPGVIAGVHLLASCSRCCTPCS
jgi:Rab-GTPase-TBC domain